MIMDRTVDHRITAIALSGEYVGRVVSFQWTLPEGIQALVTGRIYEINHKRSSVTNVVLYDPNLSATSGVNAAKSFELQSDTSIDVLSDHVVDEYDEDEK